MLARDFDLVGVAGNGRELLQMAYDLKPDTIILDIAMPLLNGLDAARQLRQIMPDCPLIVMTGYESTVYARAAFRAGASGYIVKAQSQDLPRAIRTVLRGKSFLSGAVRWRDLRDPGNPLSAREREVLELIADGKAGKEIAAIMDLSVRTVEFHRYNIMNKLDLRTTAELTRYAIREGIAPRD